MVGQRSQNGDSTTVKVLAWYMPKGNRVGKPWLEDAVCKRKSGPIAYRARFGIAGDWKATALEARGGD